MGPGRERRSAVAPPELRTERLLLRQWRTADREPFAAMNADPEVMLHVGTGPLHPVASDELRARLRREWARAGRGQWAIERTDDGAFVGFCGLTGPAWGGAARPGELEIGWRLRRDAWGHGFASEAARAALDVALAGLGAPGVVALVHPENDRSLGVAERLGMRVAGVVRHAVTGWDVLVLRAAPPPGAPGPGPARDADRRDGVDTARRRVGDADAP